MDRNQGLLEQASTLVYKDVGGASLNAHLFMPLGHKETDRRTTVMFFSAGLWDQCLISQFAPHSLHFRERGAVSIIFEYREISRHGTNPLHAIADAKSAVRWARLNAEALGLDPDKLVACGASGGAHLCASTAMLNGHDDEEDPMEISSEPNALVLFSPIVDTTRKGVGLERFPDPKLAKELSPSLNIRKDLPPMLIFQGLLDRVVPHKTVDRFVKMVKRKKNRCDYIPYAGEGHSFFNFNVNMQNFESTINTMDRFLVDLGLLPINDEDDGTNRLAS